MKIIIEAGKSYQLANGDIIYINAVYPAITSPPRWFYSTGYNKFVYWGCDGLCFDDRLGPMPHLNITCEVPPPTNGYYKIPSKTKTCECGSDKCGSPRHSSWCPKYSLTL